MLETQYYQIKGEILELASRFQNGDEEAQDQLRKQADFFPISRSSSDPEGFQIMLVRRKGELFLVEDTPGGERGVFSLLTPQI